MSAAAPARFRFDLDLGHKVEHNPIVTETAMAELLAAARREAEAAGFAAGERSATARAAKDLTAAAEALAARAAAMAAGMDDIRREVTADAVSLSLAIARKLAGGLIAREPAVELETLIADCMSSLGSVPHLVIRCDPALADVVRDIATARMTTSGFTGRLVVMGDPEIAIGDARLEWADGGIVRDIRQISKDIDARIAEYFAARGIRQDNEETGQ